MFKMKVFTRTILTAGFAVSLLAIPATGFAQSKPLAQRETAVAPEANPPGDIPDSQVFITYTSPTGFSIQVPEGWSRSDTNGVVSFVDKYGDIATAAAAQAPTSASVQQNEVADLKATGPAVDVTGVQTMTLPAGGVVVINYLSNSTVNPVTNRKIRLENRRIYFFHSGQEAIITMSAPAGADNVDAWNMMATSLRWAS